MSLRAWVNRQGYLVVIGARVIFIGVLICGGVGSSCAGRIWLCEVEGEEIEEMVTQLEPHALPANTTNARSKKNSNRRYGKWPVFQRF